MRSITMTDDETRIYDADGKDAIELMADLRDRSRALARETGETVEIYTADGIVADAVEG